ncbi:MAG TPA: HDOD domain-containing protein [Candidatus Krumholzibacteria bacterium]|nr:HDOD domain-containing protein [Candidatus Krumholzibacteria bacterium]
MANLTIDSENTATAAGAAADPVADALQAAALDRAAAGDGPDVMPMLRKGLEELGALGQVKEFPIWFVRFAERTGLRVLLLKRWTSGLQVFLEANIRMPKEAKQKRADGRAPIPSVPGDIFQTVGEEASVYAGPVPAKHFPLDLTIMLGRGSRDRHIVLLPLPAQNHWNTFLYMDSGETSGRALGVAEVLAHYALMRMSLLQKGSVSARSRTGEILRAELARRAELQVKRDRALVPEAAAEPSPIPADEIGSQWLDSPTPAAPDPAAAARSRPQAWGGDGADAPEADPFVAGDTSGDATVEAIEEASPSPTPRRRTRGLEATAAALPEAPPWDEAARTGRLTPEMIFEHSGELPALPRAAAHIMAVIEDPRTTATSLEKALAMDQALTAKVLRIANSPFYGAVREIRTVSEAIVRLGFVAIRNWTLVTAARSIFLTPGAGMLYRSIWKQSVLSAMAAQLVAQVARGREPESVFIGGLMQNIGQLVLARSHPELFQEILGESSRLQQPYHEVERRLLGFDHGELGALLIREWNLTAELEQAVRWHHRYDHEDAQNARMAAMIALGEEVALCSGAEPDPENPGAMPPPSAAAAFLGVSGAQLAELHRRAQELHIDPHFFT